MIGLRRAAPDRQGNPMSRTAKAQERPPLQCENTKIVASGASGPGSAQSMLIELLPRHHCRVFSAISAIVRYFNKRCTADSLRERDKNSAMILRHDHNPAK
jgi:hypothetical protein